MANSSKYKWLMHVVAHSTKPDASADVWKYKTKAAALEDAKKVKKEIAKGSLKINAKIVPNHTYQIAIMPNDSDIEKALKKATYIDAPAPDGPGPKHTVEWVKKQNRIKKK